MRLKAKLIIMFSVFSILASEAKKINAYLIPGQGADERLFSKIILHEKYKAVHIKHVLPDSGMSMAAYAHLLSKQIDTSSEYIIIGTSIGGMIACEMSDFMSPSKVIIISSAKGRKELPRRYRFQKKIPLYKLVPDKLAKKGALILQPIVEPDSKKEKEIFQSMLNEKDEKTLNRQIFMILNWERVVNSNTIIHIHGTKDKTLPIRFVKPTHKVAGGSHMMTLTRAEEINNILDAILSTEPN